MSGDDIRAGDVVVCVDARSNPAFGPSVLVKDKLYRVAALREPPRFNNLYRRPVVGLLLRGLVSSSPCGSFAEPRFRKLEAAEDCFTEAMQNLVPQPLVIVDITERVRALRAGDR